MNLAPPFRRYSTQSLSHFRSATDMDDFYNPDNYDRSLGGRLWSKMFSSHNAKPTESSSHQDPYHDDLKDLSPPPYTVQDKIWDAAKQTLPATLPESPTVIAVMGPTGTGKSTFISKLAGREINIGHDLSSCKARPMPELAQSLIEFRAHRHTRG